MCVLVEKFQGHRRYEPEGMGHQDLRGPNMPFPAYEQELMSEDTKHGTQTGKNEYSRWMHFHHYASLWHAFNLQNSLWVGQQTQNLLTQSNYKTTTVTMHCVKTSSTPAISEPPPIRRLEPERCAVRLRRYYVLRVWSSCGNLNWRGFGARKLSTGPLSLSHLNVPEVNVRLISILQKTYARLCLVGAPEPRLALTSHIKSHGMSQQWQVAPL